MGGVALADETSSEVEDAVSDDNQEGMASAVQNQEVMETSEGSSGDLSYLGDKPLVSDSDCVEIFEADVVIVGGGHAGIQCAKSAAEGGLSAAVVELLTANEGGAYYLRGEDAGHFNSQWLIDQGFGPYDTEEIVMEFAKRCGFYVNLDLVLSYVENSGPMFDAIVALVPGWV